MDKPTKELLSNYPGNNKDNLIPILQEIQDIQGYISEENIFAISNHLSIPSSKIYGVATFYNQFRFSSLGKYHIRICHGTSCHISINKNLIKAIERTLNIHPGQKTNNGLFSCEIVDCIGACSLSPIVAINDEYYPQMTPEELTETIHQLLKKSKSDAI